MDSRVDDDHDRNTPPPPAEIEMRDLDDLMEAVTSTFPESESAASSERISLRRTRVDDDHDDERDRRHPSQRVGSPFQPSPSARPPSSFSALPAATATSTPTPPEAGPFPGLSNPATSGPFRFFQHMPPLASPSNPSVHLPPPQHNPAASEQRANTSSTEGAAPSSNEPSSSGPNHDPAATRPQRLNIVHQYLGGFAISFDVNGTRTTVPLPGTTPLAFNAPRPNTDTNATPTEPPTDGDNSASEQSQQQPQPQPQPQPQQQRRFPGNGGPSLPTTGSIADFLRHLSILTALSMGGAGLLDRDVEDPERAKKLVDGLEDVPVGLVKRLERVGKACENNEDGTGADGTGLGDGGCAICWERLLTREREDEAQAAEQEHTGTDSVPLAESSDSHPQPTTDLDTDETATGDYKRIVSLPCAHVFHAKCLIPWFSKPKQTTCPICRFNIDPENLTFTSGAQRRAAARREREQERTRARAEGRADDEERDEEAEDRNGGDGLGFGTDFSLFGATPIVVPLGGGRRGGQQQPVDASQTGAQDQPTAENNTDADAPAEDDAPHDGDHPHHDHRLHDIVTIGVDMYIGRGPPPPFAMRGGANVFQFPFPGGADGASMNAAADPTGNHPPPANTNTNDVDGATTSQPPPPNAGENNANERGEGRGTGYAIPLGQGFGRILGETFSRIFAGGHAAENGNREQEEGPRTGSGGGTNEGQGEQSQGRPMMYGPERPPASSSSSSSGGGGGSMPMPPGGVGIGVGGGGGRGPFSFSFPVGGGDGMQNGGQQQQQGVGGGGAAPRMFETMIPLLDILFGPRMSGQTQGDGQVPAEPAPQPSQQQQQPEPQPAPQLAQPQPQHANLPPSGFGWTVISGPAAAAPARPPPRLRRYIVGSPPPSYRPVSAPPVSGHRSRQQQQDGGSTSRKVWVPPPAPGLSLRQRVEKKEQEAGLRCCDVSCGVGPSDEDPWVDVGLEGLRQLRIKKLVDGDVVIQHYDDDDDAVCDHTFHSSCLVSAERVASRGVGKMVFGEEVEVCCPVCRGVGRVSREEWERGVGAL